MASGQQNSAFTYFKVPSLVDPSECYLPTTHCWVLNHSIFIFLVLGRRQKKRSIQGLQRTISCHEADTLFFFYAYSVISIEHKQNGFCVICSYYSSSIVYLAAQSIRKMVFCLRFSSPSGKKAFSMPLPDLMWEKVKIIVCSSFLEICGRLW